VIRKYCDAHQRRAAQFCILHMHFHFRQHLAPAFRSRIRDSSSAAAGQIPHRQNGTPRRCGAPRCAGCPPAS
jgi:hypothetical protein